MSWRGVTTFDYRSNISRVLRGFELAITPEDELMSIKDGFEIRGHLCVVPHSVSTARACWD